MQRSKFKPHGGIHPYSNKELTSEKAIQPLSRPWLLTLPLRQHTGTAALPIVDVGQQVDAGQMIAKAINGSSAPIHASLSGTITRVVAGDDGAITLQVSPKQKSAPKLMPPSDLNESEAMLWLIEQAGIVGLGGAMFPTAAKIRSAMRYPIEYLIINGSECEPYLTVDDRLMREQSSALLGGIHYLQKLIKAKKIYIGIEDNKMAAIHHLDQLCQEYDNIEVVILPSLYPMGSAKQLIEAVTGRQIPRTKRSTEMGVLVQNIGTCIAIFEAIQLRQPLTHRVITVSGRAVETPCNLWVPLGTPVRDLINQCNGLKGSPERIILGGPMMGQAIDDLLAPVTKGTSGLLLLSQDEVPKQTTQECLRCGRCVDVCPMNLAPLVLFSELKIDNIDSAKKRGIESCLLCGSCSYICPSSIPLTQFFGWGLQQVKIERNRTLKAEKSKRNSELKRARLANEAAEKAAAKAARRSRRNTPPQTNLADPRPNNATESLSC